MTLSEATPEQLIESLADAGDLDAAGEVLDAIMARTREHDALLPLQARMFLADEVPLEVRRLALTPWTHGALEQLAAAGYLRECAAGARALADVFADEVAWRTLYARVMLVLDLCERKADPAFAPIAALLERGEAARAFELLLAHARANPQQGDLQQCVSVLHDLLAEPGGTRPYGAVSEDQASAVLSSRNEGVSTPARIQQKLRAGELRSALSDVALLSAMPGASPRWTRLHDALTRLVACMAEPPIADEEVTQRTGPIERVDFWLRLGDLTRARSLIRTQLDEVQPPATADALHERLRDLDLVLDGTLPTPLPQRPSSFGRGINTSTAPVAPNEVTLREASPVQALEHDTGDGVPTSPEPETTPTATPVAGDVKVGKRKIVRLS